MESQSMPTNGDPMRTVEKKPRMSSSAVFDVKIPAGVTPSPDLMQLQTNFQRPSPLTVQDAVLPYVYSKTPEDRLQGSKVQNMEHIPFADLGAAPTTTTMASNKESPDLYEAVDPRRSGRERTSTVIEIDGHTVLKTNNYVMKGLSYHYGDNTVAMQGTSAVVKKRKAPVEDADKKPKAPRKQAPAEIRRHEHNQTIRNRIQKKFKARLEHLARHLPTLEPFLDASAQSKLASSANNGSEPTCSSGELFLQPDAIQADLRDYQLAGLNWMAKMHEKNLGMILGDEMGLGKTLQTISLLCHLKEKEGVTGPSLVICPLSVLYSWCNELKKWAPSLKILRFHSSSEIERQSQRATFLEDSCSYDVVVTTYEMAKQPQLRSLWSRQYFNYLVLDEGHKIKDATTQISQAVRKIHRENALILTGTPVQNNLVELWALLNFLYPDIFTSNEPFAEAFDLTLNVVNKDTLQSAQKLLSLFMLRRLKDEVEKLMPKKIETKVLCPLSSTQVFWYKALLMKDIRLLANSVGDGKDDANVSGPKAKTLSNLVMQLRKCCLHPFLFDGAEDNPDETSLKDLIAASGKLAVLDKLLRSLYVKGHRSVLFSQFTSVLDILEDYCVLRGWNYCRFDGSTARATRNYIVNSFNEPGSDKFIFLMSTRSGGMGLNLQTADTCILYDSDWNPQPDLQAMARVHRIGQTKTVHVYRLVTNGTIEERMVERAQKKLYMDRMVNTSGGAGVNEGEILVSDKDVVSTLRFGCNAVFGQDTEKKNNLPTDEDIDTITDRNRSEDFSNGNLKGGVADKTDDFEATKDLLETTKLAGIDFKAIRDAQAKKDKARGGDVPRSLGGISDMWRQLQDQKRRRKSRLVMLDGMKTGYGKKSVPVLAANNYELETGESSVFSRELQNKNRDDYGVKKNKRKKSGVDFENQDFCQVCGDGGDLVCCPRCPVSVHVHTRCSGVRNANEFMCCSHHRCVKCNKNTVAAGGLLFACESCANAYCEDCRPETSLMLGDCERFKKLSFSTKGTVYIHCSTVCTKYAKIELGWEKPSRKKAPCPPELDVSDGFGAKVEEALEEKPRETETRLRRRKRKPANPPQAEVVPLDVLSRNENAKPAGNTVVSGVTNLTDPPTHSLSNSARNAAAAVSNALRNPLASVASALNYSAFINGAVATTKELPKEEYEIVKNGNVRTLLI